MATFFSSLVTVVVLTFRTLAVSLTPRQSEFSQRNLYFLSDENPCLKILSDWESGQSTGIKATIILQL